MPYYAPDRSPVASRNFISSTLPKAGEATSRTISSTVHAIQRCMATSNPSAWWDGLVVDADGSTVTVALLNSRTVQLRIVGPAVDIAMGEPVACHQVAELLSASAIITPRAPRSRAAADEASAAAARNRSQADIDAITAPLFMTM